MTSLAITAGAVENNKLSAELVEKISGAGDNVLPVCIFLKNRVNESEVEKYVLENYENADKNADIYLKYYRQRVSEIVSGYVQTFVDENKTLFEEITLQSTGAEFLIANVTAENLQKLAEKDIVTSIDYWDNNVEVINQFDDTKLEPVFGVLENTFGKHDHYNIIGTYSGAYLVYANDDIVRPADYTETLGGYTFKNNNQVSRYELGLYVIHSGAAYTLKDAYDRQILDTSDIIKIAEDVNNAKIGVTVSENENNAVFKKVAEKFGQEGYYSILGDNKGFYLVRVTNKWIGPAPYCEIITKGLRAYIFKSPNHYAQYPLGLYVVKNNEAYTLREAADKDVIGAEELDIIAKLAEENSVCEVVIDDATICPKKTKLVNTLKVTANNKTVKAKKLKTKKQTVKALTIKNAQGKFEVKLVKKGTSSKIFKKITVNKKGVLTLKKGKYAKKTYKIRLKITAKGNAQYFKKTVYKTVKIKVK